MALELGSICPHCGQHCEAALEVVPGADPAASVEDGDLTFCMNCGAWSMFDLELPGKMRKPTRVEQWFVDRDKRCLRMVEIWRSSFGKS